MLGKLAGSVCCVYAHGIVMIRPLHIGNVRTGSNLVLSPMSGVTDSAFRRLVRRCSGPALGMVVTEFIAAEGLSRDNPKTMSMMRFRHTERPIAIQIFGADVDRMVRAAVMVEETGANVVDINCGCPAPKVVKRGGGAGLMREPRKLGRIIEAVRKAVSIPVTLKIRSGWDENHLNALECAKIAEAAGASMLAVHARTRMQMYRGDSDWSLVARLQESISMPVLGSGDVVRPEDAERRLREGVCDGVMVGRAALDNPWVFAQIDAHLTGGRVFVPGVRDRLEAMAWFRDALREDLPDKAFVGRYRGFACRMIKAVPGAASARQAIGRAPDVETIDGLAAEFLSGGVVGSRAAA